MPDIQPVDLAKAGLLLARLDRCDHGGASEQVATVLGPAMLDEIADLRAKLEQAYVTIRAFVEPGGEWETEYGNGQWDCWGNKGEGYEPDTHTRKVFYGPAAPIQPVSVKAGIEGQA